MKTIALILSFIAVVGARAAEPPPELDRIAEEYVKLVLALGEHDAATVDAYYGPPAWREEAKKAAKPLAQVREEAAALRARVSAVSVGSDRMLRLRRSYLDQQLGAVIARAQMVEGKRFPFDEEVRLLYGITPARYDEAYFDRAIAALERELPGEGTLLERLGKYNARFHIPSDKLDAVMRAAVAQCRAITFARVPLPEGEQLSLEYVKNKSWSGYNWYQGGLRSLIQINTDLPVGISRAVDLACHEAYPGHHTWNILTEDGLVRKREWVEGSVYPLFSPASLIAEGTANYGIELAFPGDARMQFDRDVLFPLAGLDPKEAPRYHRILALTGKFTYATNEAARRYLDGKITREQAIEFLMRYGVSSRPRASQQMDFVDENRSYVVNYNLGKDLVRKYIEKRRGADARWKAFIDVISTPTLPSDLK